MGKTDEIWDIWLEHWQDQHRVLNEQSIWDANKKPLATLDFDDSEESIQLAQKIQEWLQTYKAYNGKLMYTDGVDYVAHVGYGDDIMNSLDVLSGNLYHDSTFDKFFGEWQVMDFDRQENSDTQTAPNTVTHTVMPIRERYEKMLPELAKTLMLDQETIEQIKHHAGGVNTRRSRETPVKIYMLDPDAVYDYDATLSNDLPFHEFYNVMDYNTIGEWERAEEFDFEEEYTGWLDQPHGQEQDEELTELRLKTAMSMLEHLGMVVYFADFSGGEDTAYIIVNHSRSPHLGRRLALRDAYVKAWAGWYELQQMAGVGQLEEQYEDLVNMYDLGNEKSPFYVKNTPSQQLTNFDF